MAEMNPPKRGFFHVPALSRFAPERFGEDGGHKGGQVGFNFSDHLTSTLSDYRTDLLVKLLPAAGGVGCALAFAMAEFHLAEDLGPGGIPAGQKVVQ